MSARVSRKKTIEELSPHVRRAFAFPCAACGAAKGQRCVAEKKDRDTGQPTGETYETLRPHAARQHGAAKWDAWHKGI